MSDANKALVRRLAAEVYNRHDVGALERFFAPAVVDHGLPAGFPSGLPGVREYCAVLFAAFPDLEYELGLLIADEDRVASRDTLRGTHRGEFFGALPTGRRVTFSAMQVVRCAGGRIVERWGVADLAGVLRQAGLLPAPAPGPPQLPARARRYEPPSGLPPI